MTALAQRYRHAGARRLTSHVPRRRQHEALALVLLLSVLEALGRRWTASAAVRAGVVVLASGVLAGALLAASAAVLTAPLRNPPAPIVTPYPGGWTYTP
jgi:hypothetical protein